MDTDIRKPDKGAMHIDRPSQLSQPSSASPSQPITPPTDDVEEPPLGSYTEPISEGEEDENMDVAVAKDEGKYTKLNPRDASEAIKFREELLRRTNEAERKGKGKGESAVDEEDGPDEAGRLPYLRRRSSIPTERPRNLAINPLAPASTFDKSYWSKVKGTANGNGNGNGSRNGTLDEEEEEALADGEEEEEDTPDTEYVRHFKADAGKKISVPVRIEPPKI